jgi:Na+/H+ antiporter NhaC
MTKKAQLVSMIISVMVFMIVFAIFLSSFMRTASQQAVDSGAVGGIELFFLANFQIWVLVGLVLGVLYLSYIGR